MRYSRISLRSLQALGVARRIGGGDWSERSEECDQLTAIGQADRGMGGVL